MVCEECVSCPIKDLCDMADRIIDDNMSLDGEHDVLMAIYAKGRAEAIDEFVKAIEKHQTRQDSYLEPPYVEMGLDMTDVLEVAEQLKEQNNG